MDWYLQAQKHYQQSNRDFQSYLVEYCNSGVIIPTSDTFIMMQNYDISLQGYNNITKSFIKLHQFSAHKIAQNIREG